MYTQKDKTKFRNSSKWKKFRLKLRTERKVDELTRKPLHNRWNLHHMDFDPNQYECIEDESHFLCLNQQTHEFLHWWMRYYLSDPSIIDRLKEISEKHREINTKSKKMSLY